MISAEAEARPSTACVLKHPFFWSPEKQLLFFQVCWVRRAVETQLELCQMSLLV